MQFRKGCVFSVAAMAAFVAGAGPLVPSTAEGTTSFTEAGRATVQVIDQRDAVEALAGLAMPFVLNAGQLDERVRYYAPTSQGVTYVLRDGRLVYKFPGQDASGRVVDTVLAETFVEGRPAVTAGPQATTRVSDFHGKDPARWHSDLPTFTSVELGEVWPGIAVALHARGTSVEKFFTVAPGADVARIRVRMDGAAALQLASTGALRIDARTAQLELSAPVAWQEVGGARRAVPVAYVVRDRELGFELGIHDPGRAVVIDPILQSTYLGGSARESQPVDSVLAGKNVSVAVSGSDVYVASSTVSANFPGTIGGAQPTRLGSEDGFVVRLSSDLKTLVQATYLGDNTFDGIVTRVLAMAVDANAVYIAGSTNAPNLPGSAGGYDPVNSGGQFVAKLNRSLTQVPVSTFFTARSLHAMLVVDGTVFIAGNAYPSTLPGTTGAAQTSCPAPQAFPAQPGDCSYVASLNTGLTTLNRATYYGNGGNGTFGDAILNLAIGASGLYVAGVAGSPSLPGSATGAQPACAACTGVGIDGFVALLDPSLTSLVRSTFIGGTNTDEVMDIAANAAHVYASGFTQSANLPGTTGGAFAAKQSPGSYGDAFIIRLSPDLTSFTAGTYYGIAADNFAGGVAAQTIALSATEVFIGGLAGATVGLVPLPGVSGGAQATIGGGTPLDGYVARFSSTLATLNQATYFGGSGEDGILDMELSGGNVYAAGTTASSNLPFAAGGAQATYGGAVDAFATLISADLLGVDTIPDPFTFIDQTGVALSTVVTSNTVAISGLGAAAAISVVGGEYRINTGTFTSAAGTINNGDTVQVRHTSAATGGTATNTTLTVGGVSDTFTSTTLVPDTTPVAFSFTDQTDVPTSTTITSNAVTISGINAAAPVSVSGGEYSVNGGAFTALAGTVNNGNTIAVRHTSSSQFSTATNTTLTVGGVADTFTSTTLAQDSTPDAFAFVDQTGVQLDTLVVSNSVTIAGINTATAISVTGGEYSIGAGAFTNVAGTVTNGQSVRVRHTSAATGGTATDTTLTIGGVSDTFTSTTLVPDTAPDPFSFVDQSGVLLDSLVISNAITVSGINTAAPISVSGGEYSIGVGPFTAAAGTVTSGQGVRVRHTSASTGGTATNTTLTIGGVSDTFTSTTLVPDTAPDAFSFVDQSGVALGVLIVSNAVTVSGINTAAPIAVTGGEYSIGGGVFTAAAGTVTSGQSVRVRHTSAATGATATNTTLTIGGVSDTFTSTTLVPDTVPAPFVFEDQLNVPLGTVITSNAVVVSSINAPAPISVAGGEYSINGAAFTAAASTVLNGDTVRVRHTSAGVLAGIVNTTLTIGGVADTFSSTTIPPDPTPDPFTFTDQTGVARTVVLTSNAITVSGINTATSIAVTGGEYSVNGGAFTAAAGVVLVGDQVRVRHTSSADFLSQVSTLLTIGGVSDTFTSTTIGQDTTPDPFGFTAQTGIARGATVASNSVTVAGVNAPAAISISGGEYSVNGGPFTTAAGTVVSGDSVVVRLTASSEYDTEVTATLTIGGVSGAFRVRTEVGTTVVVVKSRNGGGGFGGSGVLLLLAAGLLRASRRRRASALAGLALLGMAATAQADGGFYLGAGAGWSTLGGNSSDIARRLESATGDTVLSVSIDDTDTSYFVRAGYALNEWFAGEVAYYDFGRLSARVEAEALDPQAFAKAVPDALPRAPSGPALQARFSWPMSEQWGVHLRAGAVWWDSEQEARLQTGGSGEYDRDDDGTSFIWGAALSWRARQHLELSLEFNGSSADGEDTRAVDLGVTWLL